ncbi:MAG: sigma-54-dependent transcriptional regulator [Vicinamibacterales bacterium]
MIQVLVVEDDEQMQFFLREALLRQGYGVTVRSSAEDGLAALRNGAFDLLLMDVRLPGMSGLVAVDEALRVDPHIPIIVMTAHASRSGAIEAIRRGAYDYFTKPFRLEEMEIVIRRAVEKRRLLIEIERLRGEIEGSPERGRLVSSSQAMRGVLHLVSRAAPTDSTVLIVGESGTGKELIAETIHKGSPRRDGPFVKLNCAAIPEALLESELFGYEKGAFTGAMSRKPGKFEIADEGTLLLDEIGDMSMATQSKILRVLQEQEFERVGGTQTVRVNVRIVASTNKDLPRAVKEGRFRDDLYFRLNVVTIQVPPLRERREEIRELAEHFVAAANARLGRSIRAVSEDAMAALLDYDWPGNVRELRNAIERAAVVADGDLITLNTLPPAIQASARGLPSGVDTGQIATASTLSLDDRMTQLEKAFLLDALSKAGGVQAAAARLLGITERSVWHLVKKHRIEVDKIREKAPERAPEPARAAERM